MAHLRCQTFNILNNHMPNNLHYLTLASHNFDRTAPSPPMSPRSPYTYPCHSLGGPHLGDVDNDFQSNGQVGPAVSDFDARLSGLGINYPQLSKTYAKVELEEPRNRSPEIIRMTPTEPERVHEEYTYLRDGSSINHFASQNSPLPLSPASLTRNAYQVLNTVLPGRDGVSPCAHFNDEVTESAFSSIAAASGVSVDLLATHLSRSAEFALRYVDGSQSSFPPVEDYVLNSEGSLLSELLADLPATWPVYLDVHCDHIRWIGSSFCVNPAEITTGCLDNTDDSKQQDLPFHTGASPFRSFRATPEGKAEPQDSQFTGLGDTGDNEHQYLPLHSSITPFHFPPFHVTPEVKSELYDDRHYTLSGNLAPNVWESVMSSTNAAHFGVLSPMKFEDDSDEYELSENEYLSRSSSPFPSPCPRRRPKVSNGRKKNPRRPQQNIQPIVEPPAFHHVPNKDEGPAFSIDLGTPVLNAHSGIDIEELKAKAERYRLRNSGRICDNSWLASFAGRLSREGGLLKDYRCYVNGCLQVNKRRDHILIHLGSHLDQRPFACAFCPSQFFRNNECKRHELSHSGTKPFVCPMCPGVAFVRQDLLKRHTVRTHDGTSVRKRKAIRRADKENKEMHPMKKRRREGK